MIKIAILAGALGVATSTAGAQTIETDRPDQTETSNVVGAGVVQIELGSTLFLDRVAADDIRSVSTGALIRIGLLQTLELRISGALTHEQVSGVNSSGIGDVSIGTKVAITAESGSLPEIALIGHLTLPAGSEGFYPDYVLPDFRFSFGHTLSQSISLGYNLGGEWGDKGDRGAAVYTLALGLDIAENMGTFIEVFGRLPDGALPEHSVDGGIAWQPVHYLQFDLSGGLGISSAAPDAFVGVGVSIKQ